MKPESICERMRVEISARLDGEVDEPTARALDEHLRGCPGCLAHQAQLERVRTRLRVAEAPTVPDLTRSIMQQVAARGPRERRHDDVKTGLRIGALTAAAAALLLLGTSLPFVSDPPDTAVASEVTRHVRAAAQALDSYRATFSIVERGYNAAVGPRRFVANVSFEAPEDFRLQLRDLTTYPDERWPSNDFDLIANERQWWIREPSTCPAAALPACAVGADTEIRSIVERQPFDGTSALPTDIIVPLETLVSAERFEVLGETTIAGRDALRVSLEYRNAVPLVNSLEPGGLWRSFHPLDQVVIWIDSESWFPLRYDVVASDAAERELWAATLGYRDRPGERLLSVRATEFERRPDTLPQSFEAPQTGVVRTGNFDARDFAETRSWIAPEYRGGLRPYRAGVVGRQRVLTYSRGMTWLKLTAAPSNAGLADAVTAQEIELGGGFAYYRPASEEMKRRIDVMGSHSMVRLESNLSRAELVRVAASLDVVGSRLPRVIERDRARTVLRLDSPASALPAWVERPAYLPAGYRINATLLSRSRDGGKTLTLYYRGNEAEYSGDGIRITQSPTIDLLAPTGEEDLLGVRIDNVVARWFPRRGELEWIDGDGIYRSVTVDSFDLSTAARVAGSLR